MSRSNQKSIMENLQKAEGGLRLQTLKERGESGHRPEPAARAADGHELAIFLVDVPERIRDCAKQVAVRFSSRVQFIHVRNVRDALQRPAPERQLLLMNDRDEGEINLAVQAVDQDDLPRWAVVILGRAKSELAETLPLEECTPGTMERVLRGALRQLELLRENQRLQGDLRSLAHRFRHDLISPLHCIHLNCELIHELLDENPAAVKKQMEAIRKSTHEIGHLIERYNEVLQASTDPAPAGRVSMQSSVGRALAEAQPLMQQRGAVTSQPEDWPEVTGVTNWIEAMWLNLLAYSLSQGQLSRPMELGWAREGDAARFWVASQYQRADDLNTQVFMPFERLHSRPGHALSLSVVHRLASLQNGQCGHERRADGFSVFYFILPLAEPA